MQRQKKKEEDLEKEWEEQQEQKKWNRFKRSVLNSALHYKEAKRTKPRPVGLQTPVPTGEYGRRRFRF